VLVAGVVSVELVSAEVVSAGFVVGDVVTPALEDDDFVDSGVV